MRLVPETDSVLHTDHTVNVFDFDNPEIDLSTIVPDMFETMREKGGVGLAAPQVGLPISMFIMEAKGKKYVCINPYFNVSLDNVMEKSLEGCLSYPGLQLTVKRYTTIKAGWEDEHGNDHEEIMDFNIGRIFQHEYDHLRGITIDMKVSKLKLNMAKRKKRKAHKS